MNDENKDKRDEPRIQGPTVLLVLLGLGIILIGLVLMAATNGQTPRVHSPQVLPPAGR